MRYAVLMSVLFTWIFFADFAFSASDKTEKSEKTKSPVGAVLEADPEAAAEVSSSLLTLQPVGTYCDLNEVESALLHLKGVLGVDIETRQGFLVVEYTPGEVSAAQMIEAVGKKKDRKGKKLECVAQVVETIVNPAIQNPIQ